VKIISSGDIVTTTKIDIKKQLEIGTNFFVFLINDTSKNKIKQNNNKVKD
jgi:hypothetical protein